MRYPIRRLLRLAALAGSLGSFSSPLPAQRPEDVPVPPPPPVAVTLKFDFGGKAPEGHHSVSADMMYSSERGYGFDFGSKPEAGTGAGLEPLRDGFVTAAEPPFFFSAKVPEGNYRVTVTLGDPRGATDTTIRSESGRLHVARIATRPGAFETVTLYANVRRPELPPPPQNAPGGSRVHMFLAGEPEARVWDEKLTLEFNGPRPCVAALEIVKDDAVPTLFVAGDSTVGDPRRGPGGNWPTQIGQFFKPEIALCNSAEGGETTKSFITGYRFDKVLSQMKPGDFFLVQFGHNDSKAQWPQTYTDPEKTLKAYLGVYLAETKRHGATLVLVTPMERRSNRDTVGRWARAMKEFAAENDVPLIDQWSASKRLWAALGDNVNAAFTDQTHLSGYGGYLLSKIVAGGIRRHVPGLAKFLREDFHEMDPSQPEPPPEYLQQSPGPGVRPREEIRPEGPPRAR